MTLENDSEHFHPSPPGKSYNPFDSDDDTLETLGLKSENVFTEQDHIGFDKKPLDEGADALDNKDLSWEEAVFGQPAISPSPNDHMSLLEKDGQLYTDKNVTVCEVPEILVCYRENNYQSVKDIVIDEGMPIHDKIWVSGSNKDEVKDSSSLLDLIRESDNAMKIENSCCQVDVVELPKSELGSEWKKDDASDSSEEVVSRNFIKITELKLEDIADCNTSKIETPSGDVPVSHLSSETDLKKNDFKQPGESADLTIKNGPECDDTLEKEGNSASPNELNVPVQQPNTGETSPELSTEYRDVTAKLDKSPNEEDITLPNSSEDVTVQESSNIMLESKNQGSESEDVEPEKPPTYQSMTRQEEATSTSSNLSSLESRFHGETSFSSITFTGPVSYAGNISLRSESSAGSTRSFAFPILQTEWNSSPERMVKADQRLVRKQKGGWVQALVCCRF